MAHYLEKNLEKKYLVQKKTYSAIAKVGYISLAVFLKRPQAELKSALSVFYLA